MRTNPLIPRRHSSLWKATAACAITMSLTLAACSSSESDAKSGSSSSGSTSSDEFIETGGKNVDDIATKIAAERKKGDVPKADIGLVLVTGTEGAIRDAVGVQEAANKLGWKVQTVDAAGDVQKMRSAMANFVNQKKDAIVMVALPTASVSSQLADAKKKGIPVINIAAVDEEVPGVSAQYSGNATAVGEVMAQKLLDSTKSGDKVAMLTSPAISFQRAADIPIRKGLKDGGRKVIERNINTANLASDVKTNLNAILDANSDLSAIWADVSAEPGIIAPILKQRGLCGKIKVYGSLWITQTIDSIKDGCITGTITSPTGFMGYAAIDQIAQNLTAGTAPEPNVEALESSWGIDFQNGDSVVVVEKANLDAGGTALTPAYDYRSFFTKLWTDQFGLEAK